MKKSIAIILTVVLLLTATVALAQPGTGFNGRRGQRGQRGGRAMDPNGMGGCPCMGNCCGTSGMAGAEPAGATAPAGDTFSLEQLRERLNALVLADEITRKQADLILKAFELTEEEPGNYAEEPESYAEEPAEEEPEEAVEAESQEDIPAAETEDYAYRSGGKHRGMRDAVEPDEEVEVVE